MTKNSLETYEALLNENEKVKYILTPNMANFMFGSNKMTINSLGSMWTDHLHKNIKLYKKHGSLVDAFHGFGINKAVIAVGAGPSFNLNKEILLDVYRQNLMFPIEEQPFIIIATNKIFKTLLNMGIYPHFTIITDGGTGLYSQLCKDIPEYGKQSVLIAGLHTDPRIIKDWDKSGGEICFYLIGEDEDKKFFKKKTGEDPDKLYTEQGANVINTLWILSNSILGSSVYMIVGNDLAFPYSKSIEQRRNTFYADGDYSQNLENRHDDAEEEVGWMGLKNVHMSNIVDKQLMYDLEPVGISKVFWVYKIWLETQVAIWYEKVPFQVYNCSEAGILGVLCKEYKTGKSMLEDKNNWYLMDELCPKAWRTRTLADGVMEFLEAKYWLEQNKKTGILTGAGSATGLVGKTDTANLIVH